MKAGRYYERAYVALVHHPVYDKNHAVVATSITNLDIHDIARACRTYGLGGYHLVHPVAAQRELASRIVEHWLAPEGLAQNDLRSSALSLVHVTSSIEEVIREIENKHHVPPLIVATSARSHTSSVSVSELLVDEALQSRPLLLLFGTGWGLVEEWMARADRILNPIVGRSDYNHLSVRSAVSILLDRLFAEPYPNCGEHE